MNIKTIAFGAFAVALAACDYSSNPAALRGANFVAPGNETNIILSFDENAPRVHGRIVNLYNGEYTANGSRISFGPFASTMMMGPAAAMETEQEYFQFMSTVESYDLRDGTLTLRATDGRTMTFTQVDEVVSESETITVVE